MTSNSTTIYSTKHFDTRFVHVSKHARERFLERYEKPLCQSFINDLFLNGDVIHTATCTKNAKLRDYVIAYKGETYHIRYSPEQNRIITFLPREPAGSPIVPYGRRQRSVRNR